MSDDYSKNNDFLKNYRILLTTKYNEESTRSEGDVLDFKRIKENVDARSKTLTELVNSYVSRSSDRYKSNKKMKNITYFVFMAILIALTAAIIVVMVKTNINEADVPAVVSLLSVGITYLGSIFGIFKVMFEYLFPSDEEKEMIDLFKTVYENDLRIEEMIVKSKDEGGKDSH